MLRSGWPASPSTPAGTGTNTIKKVLGGCVVQETFAGGGASPLVGWSFSVYDARRKKWRQTWVDDQGSYLDLAGGVKDGEATLANERTDPDGKTVIQRMVFFHIAPDSLDWRWESSADAGKTWKVLWPIHYTRRKTDRAAGPAPCRRPEHAQLDFWVGEWNVTDAGKTIATSREEKAEGGCVLVERYTQSDGYSGESVNFYDAALKKWRQTWVDAAGGVSEFAGELKDGAMRFEGESHRADGRRVLRKLVFTPLAGGRVRQFSQASTDGGGTWLPHYDYTYVPR